MLHEGSWLVVVGVGGGHPGSSAHENSETRGIHVGGPRACRNGRACAAKIAAIESGGWNRYTRVKLVVEILDEMKYNPG